MPIRPRHEATQGVTGPDRCHPVLLGHPSDVAVSHRRHRRPAAAGRQGAPCPLSGAGLRLDGRRRGQRADVERGPKVANLPVVRGRLSTSGGRTVVAARCPMCGREHRYDKGAPSDPEVAELQALGFSEEWLPCQYDLPGNFWRITFGNVRRRRPVPPRGGPEAAARPGENVPPREGVATEPPVGASRQGGRPPRRATSQGNGA